MELKGKILNVMGDSITEGVGVAHPTNRYDRRMLRDYGFAKINNYGISGTRFAYQSCPTMLDPSFDLFMSGRIHRMDKSADIVLVFGGVNDYLHGDAPFGKIGDDTPATFCGAVRYMMETLKKLYPGKTVAFATPAPCRCVDNTQDDTLPCPDPKKHGTDGRALIEYVDVVIETGKICGIPVLDLYHNAGFDPKIEADNAKYTADGLHPNDEGHSLLAKVFADFLMGL